MDTATINDMTTELNEVLEDLKSCAAEIAGLKDQLVIKIDLLGRLQSQARSVRKKIHKATRSWIWRYSG